MQSIHCDLDYEWCEGHPVTEQDVQLGLIVDTCDLCHESCNANWDDRGYCRDIYNECMQSHL